MEGGAYLLFIVLKGSRIINRNDIKTKIYILIVMTQNIYIYPHVYKQIQIHTQDYKAKQSFPKMC